jgi:hypothetical protein
MDASRVDQLLRFALGTASEQQSGRDALCVTHLVKLIYLADVAYAAAHEGQTLTDAPWRFHHFGPYAEDVVNEVRRSLARLGATQVTFGGGDERSAFRWHDEDSLHAAERALPGVACVTVRRALRDFGTDLPRLLQAVYTMPPIEGAAPGSRLDFQRAVLPPVEPEAPAPERTTRQKKKFAERAAALRAKLAEMERARAEHPPLKPQPRYDEVFTEGTAWLDGLAGTPPAPYDAVAAIDPSVWEHGDPVAGGSS